MADDQAQLVRANSVFCFDLYTQLSRTQGNVFFSPYSISTALAMTYAGAHGATHHQMAKVLGFDPELKKLHESFADIQAHLESANQGNSVELSVANAIWSQQGQAFLDAFVNTVTEHYAAPPRHVDFEEHTEDARDAINTWVEKQTNGKIVDLLKPGVLDSLTRLVLVNAIYFKGQWANQFDEALTRHEPFRLRSGDPISVPMMNQTRAFRFLETKGLQILELPYAGDTLSMFVLLTKEMKSLDVLEDTLTAAKLDQWVSELKLKKVAVTLPRFSVSSEFDLADTLAGMGMPDAFNHAADFSGMSGSTDLQIAAVVHKAFVDVGESGTEAAAATAVVKKTRSASRPPAVFRADHPFLFLIRDDPTGSILFIGRLSDPASVP